MRGFVNIFLKLLLFFVFVFVVMDGKIKKLPIKWNNQTVGSWSLYDPKVPGILHYIGAVKPWSFPDNIGFQNRFYFKYWDHSELFLYKYYYLYKYVEQNYVKIFQRKLKRVIKNLKDSKFTFEFYEIEESKVR